MAYQMRGGGSFEDTTMRAITAKTADSDKRTLVATMYLRRGRPTKRVRCFFIVMTDVRLRSS